MTRISIPYGYRPFVTDGTFPGKIGPLYFKHNGDSYSYGFLAEESHANYHGVVHGGMLMSFLDEALGQIVWRLVGKKRCATISLNCDFVSSSKPGDWIELRADLSRKGQAVVFIRGELLVDGNRIMTADGIWKIIGA
ncbi:MAG: PaaI family thioesterase [Sneathiella sp.]|uniref:PaaI family thioesterase n=1 Tax=Sneathiella sp. TaxID=1964365 RepID=UPI003002F2C0